MYNKPLPFHFHSSIHNIFWHIINYVKNVGEVFTETISIAPSSEIGSANVTIMDNEAFHCTKFLVFSIEYTDPAIFTDPGTVTIEILDDEGK